MAYLRFIIVLGVMLLPASIAAHAATVDDAYIAGYAAGVLKHGLKLDMRYGMASLLCRQVGWMPETALKQYSCYRKFPALIR